MGGGGGSTGGGSGGGGTGGSGGSGGSGGGTATDGGCHAQFCDDFERPDGGGLAPWKTSLNGGGIAKLDTQKAHSGNQSVLITNPGDPNTSYERAFIELTNPFFPVSGNAFYGRMWIWLTGYPSQTTHWTNISGEGNAMYMGQSFSADVRYGGQYSPRLMANYDSSTFASDCWQHSQTGIPDGGWACMEWHYVGDEDKMEFWLDGTQLTDLTMIDGGQGCINNGLNGRWLLPQFTTLHLGWEHYQVSDPIQMWIDDVALDTGRIGCQ